MCEAVNKKIKKLKRTKIPEHKNVSMKTVFIGQTQVLVPLPFLSFLVGGCMICSCYSLVSRILVVLSSS